MTALANEVRSKFIQLYKKEPLLVRSPGRINLIGEHTDYNDGFVMPAAIDKEIIFAIAPSYNQESSAFAFDFQQEAKINFENPAKVQKPAWANYLLGVLFKLKARASGIQNFNVVFAGNIPAGAGLSSSAALECGFAFALNELFDLNVPKQELITISQWAEHNFVGVKCGIMDQFASMMGKDNSVIMLDCRSMEYKYVPMNLEGYDILLCDTKVKHSLVDSEYNTRREECEAGVKILKSFYPEVSSLRDVSSAMLEKHKSSFSEKVYSRCAYVVGEIERVPLAAKDLSNGELKAFGEKMYATHHGLSKMYEVSCVELDFLVDEARNFKSILGARMMGGGFGGCTINIVAKESVEEVIRHLTSAYKKKFNIDMAAWRVNIRQGTSVLSPSIASIS